MTSITGDWINTPGAQALCHALTSAGHQVYFVGGCVRNDLLGAPITDLDLCTDARPERVIEVANKAGMRPVPTGIEHGTVTVVVDGLGLEVTTFRKDVEADGRRAVVAFSDSVEDDAHRRDFTMNALYAAPDGQVFDPLGGLPDLDARRIRFIDDAGERIREDYLRTLRFFRFFAWYGDQSVGIDQDGLAAISANLDGLETLSKERVGSEILKLLAADDPSMAVASMEKAGVLSVVLPGSDPTLLPVLVHMEAAQPTDAIRRLAILGGQDVADRLRLSKRDRKQLQLLREGMEMAMPPAELAYRFGEAVASSITLLRAAQFSAPVDGNVWDDIKQASGAIFPVKSADLSTELAGPALGARLRELENSWIASGFTLSREDLLK